MAESMPQRQRFNYSRNENREIFLKQIVVDKQVNLCHRDEGTLEPEKLENLSTSLIQEGLTTPMTVYETDQTIIGEDGAKLPVYTLVSGHRRYRALREAITKRLDLDHAHESMKLSVVVMVAGEEQSKGDFQQDVIVRSVTENEQRTKHTALERLEIVKQLEEAQVPVPRAASALSIGQTQYSRDQLVVKWSWLHEAVKSDKIGASDAAALAETANKHDRVEQFRQDFEAWVARKQKQLDHERRDYEKLQKKFEGAVARIKKYMNSKIVKHWQKCLENGQRFGEDPGSVTFGVVVNDSDRKLTISSLNSSFDKLTSEDLATVIRELQTGARNLVPLKRQLEQMEKSQNVSQEEIDAELPQINEQARLEATQRAQTSAGREPSEALSTQEAESHSLADEIERGLVQDARENQEDR